MNPTEMRRQRAQELSQARSILAAAESAGREVTDEERQKFDAHMTRAAQLLADAERRERLDTIETAERESAESQGRASNPLPHQDPANTRGGQRRYSLMKALRQRLETVEGRGKLDGLELEVHQELAKRKDPNRPVRGVLVPWDLAIDLRASGRWSQRSGMRPEARALDTTAGSGAIPTILETTIIDLLRARMVTRQMGARVMVDMQGLFAIPRQNQAGTFYWVAEGSAPTGSNQTADQVAFTPHTGGAFTDYTRRFMEQTNQDAEEFVKDDLVAIVARGVETAALNGSGSSNQPKGLLQNSSVGTVAIGTNGGAPTWDVIVNCESNVAVANADMGKLGYVTDAAVRGKLKRTLKVSGSNFPVYLWDTQAGDTPVNGYPTGVTNLLPTNLTKGTGTNLHSLLFGNWDDLIYAFWSGVDLLVDPYTGSSSGTVRVVALQDMDVNVRHPESFQKVVDLDPT